MSLFSNKNVYLFGGSSGIGLAAAKEFAKNGGHIAIFARNADRLEKALTEISSQKISEDQIFFSRQLDVTDCDQVTQVLNEAVSQFGVPDILINLAGRAEPRYFEDITYDQLDRIMKVNVYGSWNTIATLYPFMKKNGGTIVNTSSVAGFVGVFGYSDYSASKFALIGLSEALCMEFKPHGIHVAVLCPPDTDTPLLHEENKIKPKETKALSAGAKMLSAEEVATALLKGIKRKKFLIIPGTEGKIIHFLKRFFPSLVARFMDNTVRKVQKG